MYPSHNSRPSYPAPPPRGQFSIDTFRQGPFVVYTLLGITFAVYLLQMASQFALGVDYPAAIGMKVNPQIVNGELWRLITPMFLHGSILHIGFNMYALYVLGPGLERHYGHWRFLGLYALSGFAGNVMSFLFSSAPSQPGRRARWRRCAASRACCWGIVCLVGCCQDFSELLTRGSDWRCTHPLG
jgi:hypothetical protein